MYRKESRIDTQPAHRATGAVQAAGITVNTSNRVVQQIFNVATLRVQNKIDLGWSYLKEKENRKWLSENKDALSDLDEGDEDDERTESASNNPLGGSTQGQSKQQNEQKLSDTILKQIQKTIDSMGRSENTLTKLAYYLAKLRDLTSSNNTSQLREIADRGGIVAIVSTMRRHLDEGKSSRVELKARQKDDESLYYLCLQQLDVACLANLARQAKLISDIDSHGGSKAIFDAMRKYPDNANLQEKGLCAICCYAHLADKRKGLLESHDTIKVIVVAMTRGRKDVHVQRRTIVALHRLSSAGSDTCSAIGNSGGVDAVLVAMRGYPKDEKMQMLGCALLKALCRRVEANKTMIVSGRGLAIVLHAMKEHETNPDVQEEACRLFGHLSNCHLECKLSSVGCFGSDLASYEEASGEAQYLHSRVCSPAELDGKARNCSNGQHAWWCPGYCSCRESGQPGTRSHNH
ncbi:hypothetical protein ACA910_021231 [Epithemia clementina (nom. ined.)]